MLPQRVNHRGERPQLTTVQAVNNTQLHLIESGSGSCLCSSDVFVGLISASHAFLHDES